MSCAGAPVTKGCIVVLSVSTIVAAITTRQYLFDVPWFPHIQRDHQYWRFFLHHFAFTNSSELFLAVLLLIYTAVTVERMLGSVKYASFLVATTAVATALEIFGLLIGARFTNPRIPAGPWAPIFAIIYQSYHLIPSMFTWKLFGFELSNRIAFFLLSAQLISSQPPASILTSATGIVASAMYSSNTLSLRSFRLPPRTVSLVSRLLGPILQSTPPFPRPSRASLFGASAAPSNQQATAATATRAAPVPAIAGANGQTRTSAATPAVTQAAGPASVLQQWREGIAGPPSRPTNAQIDELMAIFPNQTREAVIAALQRNSMNVQLAANSLLTSS